MSKTIKVLCVGAGHMGTSHARAYHAIEGFEICGIVTRSPGSRAALNKDLGTSYAEFGDFYEALKATRPDAVSISTYPDTHASFAKAAMEAGADVFIEKPLAETVAEAEETVAKARETGRKVVIGYILRHHPSWIKFIEISHTLGKPLVMRMNLNQQSSGANWGTHKNLMSSISPIGDCGVHYVDNLWTQLPKLIPASGVMGASIFIGPWNSALIGSLILVTQGITWWLKNPEEFWDKVESHTQRFKLAKKFLSQPSRKRISRKK